MFALDNLPKIFATELQRFELHWKDSATEEQQASLKKIIAADKNFAEQFQKTLIASEYVSKQFLENPEVVFQFISTSVSTAETGAGTEVVSFLDPKKSLSDTEIENFLIDRLSSDDANSLPDQKDFEKKLREARRDFQIRTIWRDVNRLADFQSTVRELSVFAEQCISQTLNYQYLVSVEQYGVPIAVNSENITEIQPFIVLGMGKLGAGELNLSSDIDLIFAYPESGETRHFSVDGSNESVFDGKNKKTLSNQEFFIRLGQKIIKTLDTVTPDGFVFRVDMRLRPYGQSGSLVMNFDSLENYYETQGREWERYAMIKARVVATTSDRLMATLSDQFSRQSISSGSGSHSNPVQYLSAKKSTQSLMQLLQPFTYRKYIDFSVIESLRDMKRLITREVARKGLQNDVKLGAGGIREVEFIAQAFQLIRGGRDEQLQERYVLTLLPLLAANNDLPKNIVDELLDAYIFLRNTEHVIQAYQDRQTQQLPVDQDNQLRLAYVMGFENWDDFYRVLEQKRNTVSEQFSVVVSETEKSTTEQQATSGDWAMFWHDFFNDGILNDCIYDHYCGDREQLQKDLNHLLASRQILLMQESAREKLQWLMPLLFSDLEEVDNPDETLERLLALIEAIARRSVYLVLLLENPSARLQVVRLCAASSLIARQLIAHPVLLDELLDVRQLYSPPDLATLKDELRREVLRHSWDDLESHMESLRYFRMSHGLRVAACEVTNVLPLMKVSDYLTYIAEVILQHVLDLAWQQMVARYGRPKKSDGSVCDPDFIIVGYGKLGGIELGHGSDLDLVFIHNGDVHQMTEGPKEIDSPTFFTRLGQKIIHILNTQTVSGQLYEVDMRLRPSGNSGLLVTSLAGFEKYQENEAWTWEHQALVRARVVAGSESVSETFQQLRQQVLCKTRDDTELKAQVLQMREKMRLHLGSKSTATDENSSSETAESTGKFHIKHDAGGIVDIEFMVQYAVLAWARSYPSLMVYTDNIRILEALTQEGLLTTEQAEQLTGAYKTYRSMVHRLGLQGLPAEVTDDNFVEERQQVSAVWQALFES